MTIHQLPVQLCDDCLHAIQDGPAEIALMRRSHKWSLWCEHTPGDEWHPGRAEPVLLYLERK